MKKYTLFLFLVFSFVFPLTVHAYTLDDVVQHNTPEDCWVLLGDNVYDITKLLSTHDRFADIRKFCGSDVTEVFKTKGERGSDHSSNAYTTLESFSVGSIESNSPYKLLLPVLLTTVLYWCLNYVSRKGFVKWFSILKFNALFTTSMFVLFAIPTFGFGIFLILRYTYSDLYNIDFNFLFWHAQLSLVMGTLALNHFIQRFTVYKKQLSS